MNKLIDSNYYNSLIINNELIITVKLPILMSDLLRTY